MNKFWWGFLFGVISLGIVIVGIRLIITKDVAYEQKYSKSPIENNEKHVLPEVPLNIESETDKRERPIKKQISVVENTNVRNEVLPENEAESTAIDDNTDKSNKATIVELLDGHNKNDLSIIEHYIKHLHDKQPAEIYQTEPVDTVWALEKQVDLETRYYIDSPLKDIGSLESIDCRSEHCRVRIQIPAGVELKQSYYLDWLQPVSIELRPALSEKDPQTIDLYILRDR